MLVKGALGNKFQWIIYLNKNIFLQENAFKIVICENDATFFALPLNVLIVLLQVETMAVAFRVLLLLLLLLLLPSELCDVKDCSY